jgi:hypothetical protein
VLGSLHGGQRGRERGASLYRLKRLSQVNLAEKGSHVSPAPPIEVLHSEGGGHDAEAVYELVLHYALHQHRAQLRYLQHPAGDWEVALSRRRKSESS